MHHEAAASVPKEAKTENSKKSFTFVFLPEHSWINTLQGPGAKNELWAPSDYRIELPPIQPPDQSQVTAVKHDLSPLFLSQKKELIKTKLVRKMNT